MKAESLPVSDFQRRVLSIPEDFDLFLGGGRGGAKSYCGALLFLRHCEQYAERARCLYLRRSYKGLADFELTLRELFGTVYGSSARFNAQEHVWRLPNGAYVELGQLENPGDYAKYQGRSFTLLFPDEATQWPSLDMLDRLRSNLRGPKGQPLRMAIAANPGEVGHLAIAKRYVFGREPWLPFEEEKSGRTWVSCPSTFLDNPFIDQELYRKQLESSCPSDPELLRAWIEGSWDIARGAFFGSVLDEKRSAFSPWDPEAFAKWRQKTFRKASELRLFLAHDFGSSAPAVTFVCAESTGMTGPDGRFYPRGSILLLDECATNQTDDFSKGLGYTVPRLADELKELAHRWRIRPDGCADDACFAKSGHGSGSIADEFKSSGVYFQPAKKADRRTGWEILRRLMNDAGKPDVPGLYVSRDCAGFWGTVPYLPRDPRRPDDVDTRAPDHWADAARYACLFRPQYAGFASTIPYIGI
jgi:hypothetical protein